MRFLIIFALLFAPSLHADNNLGLPALEVPTNNPQFEAKIALGRAFFNDVRFSVDNNISCASCHQQDKSFTDGMDQAQGVAEQKGPRNTPTLINVAYFDHLFLDGRASDLEQQALEPMLNPIEHGLESEHQILKIVREDQDYRQRLQQVFAISEQAISVRHVAMAIASYERTLVAGNSAFDRYYFGRDRSQLSPSAARGLLVFRRKGNCANCHEISWDNALFADNRFYNIGIGSAVLKSVLDKVLELLADGSDISKQITAHQYSELGRFNVTKDVKDIGKFKTPTLRNVALTAPYMHDGSLKTLAEVIDYYDRGGDKNPFLDPAIFPLHLTTHEKADLLAFMQSLNSNQSVK
jgi:cytochrome c peroxidase